MFFFAVLVKHELNLLFAFCQKFIIGVKLRVSQPVSKPAYFVELREEIMMRVRKSREGQLHNLLQQFYPRILTDHSYTLARCSASGAIGVCADQFR
jgi:hypothetical protein